MPFPPGDARWLIKTWTTQEGVPGSDVTGLVQTSDGYLWLSTFDGLARFDGLKFTVFDRSNTPALPSNAIINLHLDQQGVLWISTDRGMVTLKNGNWKVYAAKEGWTGNYARSFAEGSGQLFVTCFDGKIFQFKVDHFEQLPDPPGAPNQGYFGHVDDQGRFWAVQFKYFGRWDNGRWGGPVPDTDSELADVAAGSAADGGLWIYHHGHVDKFRQGRRVSRLDPPAPLRGLWSLSEDRAGGVWAASYNFGLTHLRADGSSERFTDTNGLGSAGVRCVLEDREGDLWVGGSGGGLMRFKRRAVLALDDITGFPKSTIRSVAVSKSKTLYAGSYGSGLVSLKGSTVESLRERALMDCVLADSSGRIWAAQSGAGLLCFNGSLVFTNDVLSGPEKLGLALFEDSKGRIWVSDPNRVNVLKDGHWSQPAAESGLVTDSVRAFAEDADGTIWMGAYNGELYRCNDMVIHRFVPEGDSLGAPVIALHQDRDGTLWLGSNGSGLGRLRRGRLRWISRDQGLLAAEVGSVLDDTMGSFWLGSHRGVIQVKRAEVEAVADGRQSRLQCRLYDTFDGMPANECSIATQPNAVCDPEGTLWFATRRGVAAVHPDARLFLTNPPPVRIEAIEYVQPDGHTRHLIEPFPPDLRLPAGTKRLQIHYTGLSLSAPEKIRFRQRVEGVDDEWVDVGAERSVIFQDLAPGNFRFQVTAANADGVWNESGDSLAYAVLPLFWQTGWFRWLMALLVVGEAGLILGLIANHRYSVRMRAETNRQRNELAHLGRVAVLSDLSGSLAHELNQPLSGILSNAQAAQRLLNRAPLDTEELRDILQDIVSEDRRAGEVIRRMRTLLRKGTPELQPLDINQTVEHILLLAHSDLVVRSVSVVTQLASGLPPVRGDAVQIQQVLLNLILNACEAMEAGRCANPDLTVQTDLKGRDQVQISICDRGEGVPPSMLEKIFEPFVTTKHGGLGMGLALCRSIVVAHGGRIWAARNEGGGLTVSFTLAVHPAPVS